jgi:hypothetical protein
MNKGEKFFDFFMTELHNIIYVRGLYRSYYQTLFITTFGFIVLANRRSKLF